MEVFQIDFNFNRPQAFLIFKCVYKKLRKIKHNLEIEHIGSSSIRGVLTKGDVDINVRVIEEEWNSVLDIFSDEFKIAQKENWTDSFASFTGNCFGRNIGIQVTLIGGKEDTFIKFRDVLNNNYKLVLKYNDLKLRFNNKSMHEYREAKQKFISLILSDC